MKVVTVPEFSFALGFDLATDLTSTTAIEEKLDDVDETILSQSTASYLQEELQDTYPTNLHTQIVKLKFRKTSKNHALDDYGQNKSYRYWRCNVSVSFDVDDVNFVGTGTDAEKSSIIPSANDIFLQIGEAFNGDMRANKYLTHLNNQLKLNVTEVQASLKILEPTEGGVVKAPNFYIALQCEPSPTGQPTDDEKQRLIELFLPLALKGLHDQHRDFIGMDDLRIVKTEINERAGKPVVAFNLYIEFEAMGSFVRNSPPAMVFFNTIANNLPADFITQLASTVGGDFNNIRRMAINPVAYIENLHDDLPADGLADIVPVHIEFWIAFNVDDFSQNAKLSDRELLVLDTIMEKTVDETLSSVYGRKKFVGIKSMEAAGPTEYHTGLPLPRFNILRRYKADVNMRNPVPKPHLILQKVMKSDIARILLELDNFSQSEQSDSSSELNWARLKEATMGTADVNQMILKNKSFGGKKSPESRKKKKNKTKGIEIAKPIDDVPMPKAEDESPSVSLPASKAEKCTCPKCLVSSNPKSLEQSAEPEGSIVEPKKKGPGPEDERGYIVYTALTINQCLKEPSDEDYDKLVSNANDYLSKLLSNDNSEFFMSPINMVIRNKQFGHSEIVKTRKDLLGTPCIYFEWDVVCSGYLSHDAPGVINFYVGKKITRPMDFLMNAIRNTKGTAFANATSIEVGVRKLDGNK